jgi:aryl-alcohol dehydrogenase-like predicted oxidoreductase
MSSLTEQRIEKRALGATGLEIPPLVFGGNVFGWTADEKTSFSLLDACLNAGLNTIDTADVYTRMGHGFQGGESETVIGNWLRSRGGRDRVIIATKLGVEMGPGLKGLSARYIRTAVEASLQRLQTDYIDLYQAHFDDPQTPLEETLTGFAELLRSGKVRAIGASNYSAARLREALETSRRLGLPRFETFQPHYNLYDRAGFEAELQALCLQEGIGVLTYFSLASGFLTGKYRSRADLGNRNLRAMWLESYFTPRGERILAALNEVAAHSGATPAQVALSWLMRRPGVTAPIASATTLTQLRELTGAVHLQLDEQALAGLESASGGEAT